MAYTGTGNDGQVFGMSGSTTRWADASGTGGGLGVTVAGDVGLGADFTTIQAAFASSARILNVIGSTLEAADSTIPISGASMIFHNGAVVDMADNSLLFSDDDYLDIRGNGTIAYSATMPHTLFDRNSNVGKVNVNGITFANSNNNSTLFNGSGCVVEGSRFTGEVRVGGEENKINTSTLHGSIIVESGAVDFALNSCTVRGSISDNGTGTLLSDLVQ